MTHQSKVFALADPRTFDGDPFEVADRSVAQTLGLVKLLRESVDDAYVMARNAEMERECQRDEDPDAEAYAESPQGRSFAALLTNLDLVEQRLGVLRRAAGFNPRKPPKVL